jgi:TetR/AcrR family transcriptional regulator, regulator of autoinduction and epiphytic fitness
MPRNPPSSDISATDGRVQRGARNRSAIVDALIALLEEGNPKPSASDIAARAGVSVRSVFQHYDDLETLYGALVARQTEYVLEMLPQVDPALPLAPRIEAFVAGRARIFERVTPVRRATLLAAPNSPTLQHALAQTAATHEHDVASTFAADLARLPSPADARAAVTLATSWEAWDRLRTAQRCSIPKARRTVVTLVKAVLVP